MRTMLTPILTLTLSLLLAGCAGHIVDVTRPAGPGGGWTPGIAMDALQLAPASPRPPEAELGGWRRRLDDPRLEDLVAKALADGADLRIAAARLKQARAAAQFAEADRRPRVDIGAEADRRRSPRTVARDAEGFETTTPASTGNRFETKATASYELDLLGRLALARDEAQAQVAASEADQRAVASLLIHDVVTALADVRLADDQTARLREVQALDAALLDSERARLAAGLSTREALRRARDRLDATGQTLMDLRRDRHAALTRLATLTGSPPWEVDVPVLDEFPAGLTVSGALEPDLPADALARRPELEAAWARVAASRLGAERQRLERFPKLTLTAESGFLSHALSKWFTEGALQWAVGAALQSPLLDGGRNYARHEQALAQAEEQEARYQLEVVRALADVEAALARIVAARADRDDAQGAAGRRTEDEAAARRSLAAGATDRQALFQARSAAIKARARTAAASHALLVAWADAQRALGR